LYYVYYKKIFILGINKKLLTLAFLSSISGFITLMVGVSKFNNIQKISNINKEEYKY
jgi:hypothetical protein